MKLIYLRTGSPAVWKTSSAKEFSELAISDRQSATVSGTVAPIFNILILTFSRNDKNYSNSGPTVRALRIRDVILHDRCNASLRSPDLDS